MFPLARTDAAPAQAVFLAAAELTTPAWAAIERQQLDAHGVALAGGK